VLYHVELQLYSFLLQIVRRRVLIGTAKSNARARPDFLFSPTQAVDPGGVFPHQTFDMNREKNPETTRARQDFFVFVHPGSWPRRCVSLSNFWSETRKEPGDEACVSLKKEPQGFLVLPWREECHLAISVLHHHRPAASAAARAATACPRGRIIFAAALGPRAIVVAGCSPRCSLRAYTRPKPRILVAAPSNVAVDDIVERVLTEGSRDGDGGRRAIAHRGVFRIPSPAAAVRCPMGVAPCIIGANSDASLAVTAGGAPEGRDGR
jgi:hypothetical protein